MENFQYTNDELVQCKLKNFFVSYLQQKEHQPAVQPLRHTLSDCRWTVYNQGPIPSTTTPVAAHTTNALALLILTCAAEMEIHSAVVCRTWKVELLTVGATTSPSRP